MGTFTIRPAEQQDVIDAKNVNALMPNSGYTKVSKKLDNFVFQTSSSFLNKVADKNRYIKFGEKTVDTYGPELVANGDFSNGTTGWTLSGGTQSIENNMLVMYSTGGEPYARTTISNLTVGKTYKVTLDIPVISAGANKYLEARVYNIGETIANTGYSYYTAGNKEFTFTATYTSHIFRFKFVSSVTDYYLKLDNISVREIQTADFTNTVPDVAEILPQTSMTTTVQVSQGDYVLVTRTSSTDHTQTTFRAKQDAPIGTALTNTTYFEDRTQIGVTNQGLAYHAYNTLTNAYEGIKTEVLFSDVWKEDLLDNSVWMARNGFSKVSQFLYSKGSYLCLPVGIWQSLNKGAFHPVVNFLGTKAFKDSDTGTSHRTWYVSTATTNSLASCFINYTQSTSYGTGTITTSGTTVYAGITTPNGAISYDIATTVQVPDRKLYDICYPDQFIDVREYAKILNRDEVNLIIADKEENGVEEVVSMVNVSQVGSTYTGTYYPVINAISGYDKNKLIGTNFYHNGFAGRIESVTDNTTTWNLVTTTLINRVVNEPVTIVIKKPILCSNTKLSIDLIGNPTNYPQVLKDRLASGVGVVGINPLLVSDTGVNLIPDGTSKIIKASNKVVTLFQPDIQSSNNGVTWTTTNSGIGIASNAFWEGSVSLASGILRIFSYTSKNLPYIQTTPKPVIDVEPKVIASNSHSLYKGALIGNQVSGKIQVGNGTNWYESKVLENIYFTGEPATTNPADTSISYGTSLPNVRVAIPMTNNNANTFAKGVVVKYIGATVLNSINPQTADFPASAWSIVGTFTTPTHSTIALDNANSSASKYFKVLEQGNNGVLAGLNGKELAYNTTTSSYDGDNELFDQLTNGTKTDLNGRTIRTFHGSIPINGEVK